MMQIIGLAAFAIMLLTSHLFFTISLVGLCPEQRGLTIREPAGFIIKSAAPAVETHHTQCDIADVSRIDNLHWR